jgi:hypothetical protein
MRVTKRSKTLTFVTAAFCPPNTPSLRNRFSCSAAPPGLSIAAN